MIDGSGGKGKVTADRLKLTELWTRSDVFAKVAWESFGEKAPIPEEAMKTSDKELEAYVKLRRALHDGRYIGIGFADPRRHGDLAMQIPKAAWAPNKTGFELEIGPVCFGHWKFEGLYYLDVRIAPDSKHLTKSGGRPTLGPIINDSILQMKPGGEIDVSKTQVSHFDQIRETAAKLYPMHKAEILKSKDRTIAKYFSKFFNEINNLGE